MSKHVSDAHFNRRFRDPDLQLTIAASSGSVEPSVLTARLITLASGTVNLATSIFTSHSCMTVTGDLCTTYAIRSGATLIGFGWCIGTASAASGHGET